MKRCRPLLGTFVEIECDDAAAIELAFAAVERVHKLMSAHDPDSELSTINCHGHRQPVAVSDWTAAVIRRAMHWARRSGGAFDMVRAGGHALSSGRLPCHDGQPLPGDADWTAVRLIGRRVSLDRSACLDLGGIAKGFAVDRAIDALRSASAEHGLVNAGGDLRGYGPAAWPVVLVDPRHRRPVASVDVLDHALATSGGLPGPQGALEFDHLPDADRRWTSVTVRAATACDADALAKVVWAGGSNAGALLASAGAQACAIRSGGGIEAIGAKAVTA